MILKRRASAQWAGTGKEGKGHISTQSTVLDKTNFSYGSRFADGVGTNPEELMAAAHAGCFTMKLSFALNEAGFTADDIQTECTIQMVDGVIAKSDLKVKAKVPNITEEKFKEVTEDAKANCPVSKAYNLEISLEAELVK